MKLFCIREYSGVLNCSKPPEGYTRGYRNGNGLPINSISRCYYWRPSGDESDNWEIVFNIK